MAIEIDGPIQLFKVAGMGSYDNNGYVLADPKTKEAYVIDTPAQVELLINEAKDFHIKGALITHSHPDHTAGYSDFKRMTGLPVAIHQEDAAALPSSPEFTLLHGMELKIGAQKIKVLHTPGHTPGGICFASDLFLVSGDTLFPGGPGMTRSAEGFNQIIQSITECLFTLPDDTGIFPGHGANTGIGKARAEYELFSQKQHSPNLFGTVRWDQGK